ncbi:Stp1/IreP family PP2C-type Ser/Thr phosphatase [Cohnella nanjingensis]|uniref:Stp1/IreP family PP2C-type Ser/Thr phosphatase n=1 Tax=Cohnella nanjingensis TaxID=1387779 RepID=A0A7X0RZS9_9BACL|nr:Stp1/IreP family PP2C-type Ser/Thr phosphatase [Cohnella nanjingensis]MBB6675526.1 Stp1/IreP family PP2C-type Ser/Thr phosphatase [Cohnella nanjingensis]
MRLRTALRSHIGRVRQVNEDRAWIGTVSGGLTAAAVADGMGGHNAGDVASTIAIDSLSQSLSLWDAALSAEASEGKLRELVLKANTAVFEAAESHAQYHNMGTTVIIALIDEKDGLIGHIGDSRVYRVRGGAIEQLTEDHTLVNELAKSGQLSPEEAANHPRRNVLMRALGTDRDVAVDVLRIEMLPGDRLLLCSDGLSNLVERETILDTLTATDIDLDEAADRLIALALAAGGYDNVTVALIDYASAGAAAEGGTP